MPKPTAAARAALADYIKELAQLGDGLTLDDFRAKSIARALRTARVVRRTLYGTGALFMSALLATLVSRSYFPADGLMWISLWAIALGGLGAIASIFLHILKLLPQETLQPSDEVEVIGRIFLGCLFSLVLSVTLIPDALRTFFAQFGGATGQTGAGCSCCCRSCAATASRWCSDC